MREYRRARTWLLIVLPVLLAAPPLGGVYLAGRAIGPYLEFPPLTRSVVHGAFSWPVFICLGVAIAATVTPLALRMAGGSGPRPPAASYRFPAWGWGAAGLCLGSWILAWTRFSWFAPGQIFTFGPLWLGYIGVVNALTYKRSGRCMLTHAPGYCARLFFASALFWWYFEYLNRFVQNWYYVGIEDISPLKYVLFATLPFATVLPAVLGTGELLETFPRLGEGLRAYRKINPRHPRAIAAATLVMAVLGLFFIGVYPAYLFPLLWVSPLLIITSVQCLAGRRTIFTPLAAGDWHRVALLALAALICGFFWEMWNYYSSAKWLYAIPFVQRFHVFEMPLLGYAGYLPFGLECGVIAALCRTAEGGE